MRVQLYINRGLYYEVIVKGLNDVPDAVVRVKEYNRIAIDNSTSWVIVLSIVSGAGRVSLGKLQKMQNIYYD